MTHRDEEQQEPILSLRLPLDPDTEYRVVWAKKSLWKRRLEGLQLRYPSDKALRCNDDDNNDFEYCHEEEDDDKTWIMDNSQKSHAPDRWGEGSSASLPPVVVSSLNDSSDDDDVSAVSCPSQIGMDRWGDANESSSNESKTSIMVACQGSSSRSMCSESSTSSPPRVPSRRPSIQDDAKAVALPRVPSRRVSLESLQDDSDKSDAAAPYSVSWLDGFYSTVREFREDRQSRSISR